MRLKNKKTYYLKTRTIVTDSEGGKYPGYSVTAVEINANISPASGKLQAEIYGLKLNSIMNMLYDEPYTTVVRDKVLYYITQDSKAEFCEGGGICVYVTADSDPDYKIISIKPYSHLVMELEKI